MAGDAEKAARYRERAEGLRKIAADLPSGNTQRMLIGIAREYERLARLVDEGDVRADPSSALAALGKPRPPE